MKTRTYLAIIGFMFLFIITHALISEFGFFRRTYENIIPFLGGFSPSITHDSVSTRNPALEAFFAILSDLPGAYSFYVSPIILTAPSVLNGQVNGQAVPQWSGVQNPQAGSWAVLQTQQLIFLLFIALVVITSSSWVIKRFYHRRKQKGRE